MSIHTRGPFSWAGGPIGHTSANAGVATNAAAVPSTPRRDIRLENGWLSFGIVVSPSHNLWLACNNPATEKLILMSRRVKCRFGSAISFDHLVGTGEKRWRHGKAQRLGGLEIDDQLVLFWRLDRQIGRLLALEDTIDIASRLAVLVDEVRPI